MQNTQNAPQGVETETKNMAATESRMKAYAEKMGIYVEKAHAENGGNC